MKRVVLKNGMDLTDEIWVLKWCILFLSLSQVVALG